MNHFINEQDESVYAERPWTVVVVWTLRAVLALTVMVEARAGDFLYAGEALLALALCMLSPAFLRVDGGPSPPDVEIVLLLMAIGNCTLGVALNLYRALPYYDKCLHLINPVALAYLCVHFLRALAAGRPAGVSPVALALIAGLAILGASVLWEILEYVSDNVVGSSTQGSPTMSPLDDTMWDLLLNLLGALIGAIAGTLSSARSGAVPQLQPGEKGWSA